MEKSRSWEINSRITNKEILRRLWNPNVYCRAHKIAPLVPILSQINPVHSHAFLKIRFNIILPAVPWYYE
jgi:hypothetical protein